MFNIDPRSGTPIYRQVIDQVRRLITSGQLVEGDQLPSVRQLATTHAVNPMTISKAYSLLESEGLLVRQRGKAMAVAATPDRSLADRLADLETELAALTQAAQQLGLTADQVVATLRQRMETDNG